MGRQRRPGRPEKIRLSLARSKAVREILNGELRKRDLSHGQFDQQVLRLGHRWTDHAINKTPKMLAEKALVILDALWKEYRSAKASNLASIIRAEIKGMLDPPDLLLPTSSIRVLTEGFKTYVVHEAPDDARDAQAWAQLLERYLHEIQWVSAWRLKTTLHLKIRKRRNWIVDDVPVQPEQFDAAISIAMLLTDAMPGRKATE